MRVQQFPRLSTGSPDSHIGHMRPGLRAFVMASTGVKASFQLAAMRRMAFTAIRMTGRGAA